MAAHRGFFLSRSLMSLSRGLLFGCLEWHFFSPKRDSVLCLRVRQWLRKHLTLKCYTCYQRSIMIERIWFPSVWSWLLSEIWRPRGGHGTDIMPMDPCAQTTSLWEKGVWWAIYGQFSHSNLESSMMDTMSSCSGGMSKLKERRIHHCVVLLEEHYYLHL